MYRMEKFSDFIVEQKDEAYKLIVFNNSNEDVRDYIIEEMSTMFKLDNRRFDKVKFVDYINN